MDRCRRSGDSCDLWQFLFAQAWSASRRRRKREIVAIFGKSWRARNRELNFLGQWISAASSGQCWSRARPNRNSIEFCSGTGNFTAKEARRAGQSLQRSVVVFLARQSIIPRPHSPPLFWVKHPPRSCGYVRMDMLLFLELTWTSERGLGATWEGSLRDTQRR
jgi:hypothetical protein